MILWHLLLPLGYSLLFILLAFQSVWLFVQVVIGVLVGFSLLFLDRFLHVFFTDPDHEFSQEVRAEWQRRNFREMLRVMLNGKHVQEKLITRSAVFLLAYAATALFVITSTGSYLGQGVVLGLGLHYCLDLWRYRTNLEHFQKHFLWQVKRVFEAQEVTAFCIMFSCFFALLTLLAVVGK